MTGGRKSEFQPNELKFAGWNSHELLPCKRQVNDEQKHEHLLWRQKKSEKYYWKIECVVSDE